MVKGTLKFKKMKKKNNVILGMFPRRLKNPNEFTAMMKKETVHSIIVECERESPKVSLLGLVDTPISCSHGIFKYNVLFTAKTSSGRPLTYRENYSQREGSAFDLSDARQRATAEIELLLQAEKVVEKLRKDFPNAEVEYMYGEKSANGTYWQKIHESAIELKIAV